LAAAESHAERVERLFHEVREIEAKQRPAFLIAACDGDEPLRLMVERLLAADLRVGQKKGWNASAIQNEAFDAAGTDATLERYRLMEPIGGGGMGTVYKAVRTDDVYSKLVAIKIVHLGGQAEQQAMIARFRQERQILAGLEHPNIGRLLDGGSTPDGLPFLVMDYVDGVPIDQYLADKKPPLREILDLFRTVCSAVSHAHQNLVVHRDLKPGNILVTKDGRPKLLDFGIAKLLDGSAERTQTGAGAMTPEYASPEQVRGLPTNTATDIYSLGVLLYELLCGVRPYRATTSAMELAQAICSETPQSMSSRAGGRFDRHLENDLENIVQMALRKEPERRYASVEQFSEDLRKYMEGYPVMARADTRGYRARRFAGRNKAAIAAGAVILITLVVGIGATAWQARLANRRFNEVRGLANAYLFEFHDAIKDLPGSTPARQLVVKRGIQYLDTLARERGNDAGLARELASAYEKVGSVQGARGMPSLGDRAGALASYRKALAIREPLAASSPQAADIGIELSRSYQFVGDLLAYNGDLQGSAAMGRKDVQLMERLAAAHPASFEVRDSLALSYSVLGDVTGNNEFPNLGDAKGAMELIQKSRIIREKLVAENPAKREQRLLLSGCYGRIGALQQALGNKEESVASYRRAIATDEQLIREEPLNVLYRREAAVDNRSVSLVLIRTGNLAEAQEHGDRSAKLFEQLSKDDPADVEAREALADSYYSQGYLLTKVKDLGNARKAYDSAIAAYESIMTQHPGVMPTGLRTAYQLMADLGIATKDAKLAMRSAQKELDLDHQLLTSDAGNAGAQRNQGVAYTQIGQVHEFLKEWREARSWYQRALDVWLDLQKKGTLIPMYVFKLDEGHRNVAKCDRMLGRL
jgi:tetratricopeptide (TPR) repeat protein